MKRFKCLDLCCCAGGASMGYHLAGFDVVGVDIDPQPNYPFDFVQGDAVDYLIRHGDEYDFIHVSPPCQLYSVTGNMYDNSHCPDLVPVFRDILEGINKPWIMENVNGSPLQNFVTLRGDMFGLQVLRARRFESNILLLVPSLPKKRGVTSGKGKKYSSFDDGDFITVAGHNFRFKDGLVAMGIDWMKTQYELAQSIPPAYTNFLGRQAYTYLMGVKA